MNCTASLPLHSAYPPETINFQCIHSLKLPRLSLHSVRLTPLRISPLHSSLHLPESTTLQYIQFTETCSNGPAFCPMDCTASLPLHSAYPPETINFQCIHSLKLPRLSLHSVRSTPLRFSPLHSSLHLPESTTLQYIQFAETFSNVPAFCPLDSTASLSSSLFSPLTSTTLQYIHFTETFSNIPAFSPLDSTASLPLHSACPPETIKFQYIHSLKLLRLSLHSVYWTPLRVNPLHASLHLQESTTSQSIH